MRWTTTVLACADPDRVMRFWAELLGGHPRRVSEDFIALQHGSGWLAAQRAGNDAAPSWPDGERPVQLHLDIAVSDLDGAVERAVELGAQEECDQPRPESWRVLRAPGGHLFCLSHKIQDYLPVDFG